jgi:hypothetical protein
MILIYSPKLSNRLRYTIQFIFEEVCQIQCELTSDIQLFKESEKPKINYSKERIHDAELFIQSSSLLFLEGISELNIPILKIENRILVFPNQHDDHGFDVFAAIFYFISRYEEYLPFIKDKHNRFEADQSFAFKNDFLDRPIVDEWILELKAALSARFKQIVWPASSFKCLPTIDIDQLYTIKGKSLVRFAKPVLLNLLKLNFKQLAFIFKVRFGLIKDPFDQLKNFETLHAKYNLKAIYFILFSKKYTKFDINISIRNKDFRKSIRELSKTATVGIHPSYHSRYDYKSVDEEIHMLANVTNAPINSSRQHYLKLRMPNTYKSLLSLGIANEYTMGFASKPGFRAGTSHSFKFYDLKHEQTTFLTIHPFCVMDATFKTYLHYDVDQAYECIADLIQKLKEVNGTFTPLWHNESISEYGVWTGWSGLYEKMLKLTQINN